MTGIPCHSASGGFVGAGKTDPDGVSVGGTGVSVGIGVSVTVAVGVRISVGVAVGVSVGTGVLVDVGSGVFVGLGVGVDVGISVPQALSDNPRISIMQWMVCILVFMSRSDLKVNVGRWIRRIVSVLASI